MSLGEQKEQKGRGGRGWWQQHKLGGTVEGQKCAGLLAFLLKQKKTKGGSGQVTARPMAASRGSVSVRPSRVLAVNIHFKESCKTLRYQQGDSFPFPSPFCWDFPVALAFPAPLVSCSHSTLAPSPRRAPSGTGGATGFEARRGNTGIPPAGGCWEGTGCPFEVHTASRWAGESFGAGTCCGCLRFGATCGWPRCPGGA